MSEPIVPPWSGNNSFHAQHSPMGACWSFTLGRFGSRGGFALRPGQVPSHDLYIGVKQGNRTSPAPLVCLPFYQPPDPSNVNPNLTTFPHQVQRHYGFATDRWVTPDFEFTMYTPFGGIVEPGSYHPAMLRVCLMPAIVAELTIDNTAGTETRTGVFAMNFHQPGAHILPAQHGWRGKKRVGFGLGRHIGVQATLEHDRVISSQEEPFAILRGAPDEGLGASTPVHGLGTCPGFGFEVPPGKRQTLLIALGVYLDGIVTTGIEGRHYYTRHFSDLSDVLDQALRGIDPIRSGSQELDRSLLESGLSPDQQFLIAHATRSYYSNTQLLDVAGEPVWVVHSGDSGRMNVMDDAIDQAFWELRYNPWVVRNRLDNFVKHYGYHDQLKRGSNGQVPTNGALVPGGLSFCHDMGAHFNFAPAGHSSYELPNQTGRFSFSAQEQLCNWILLAASYVARTGDMDWLRRHEQTIDACFASMCSRAGLSSDEQSDRGHEQSNVAVQVRPARRASAPLMLLDTARCGTGQETVSYASLDSNFSKARGNLCLAVKTWAAYLGLAQLYNRLGRTNGHYAMSIESASAVAAALAEHADEDGLLPASLDHESPARISRCLLAAESLVFPVYWLSCEQPPIESSSDEAKSWFGNGKYQSFLHALKQHTRAILSDQQQRELFSDGGMRISSTSSKSWPSKLAIFQHIAREVFYIDEDPDVCELFARADAALVKWQSDAAATCGWCDEFESGKPTSARFSARGVTTALWLK